MDLSPRGFTKFRPLLTVGADPHYACVSAPPPARSHGACARTPPISRSPPSSPATPGLPSLTRPFLSFQGPALPLPRDSSPRSHLRRPQLPTRTAALTTASPGLSPLRSSPPSASWYGARRGLVLDLVLPSSRPVTGPRPSWAAGLSRLESSDLRLWS